MGTAQPETTWHPAEVALVRASLGTRRADLCGDDFARALLDAGRDAALVDAIALAAPRLGHVLAAAADGVTPTDPNKLRRSAMAATAYRLRMAARPTPHGLFAGVATARFGPADAQVKGEQVVVRPDQAWLVSAVRTMEADPDVLLRLSVHTDPGVHERAGRFVVSACLLDAPSGDDAAVEHDVTVRATPAIRAVLSRARNGADVTELIADVAQTSAADGDVVTRAVCALVAAGFLRTSLLPPAGSADPIGELVAHLDLVGLPERAALFAKPLRLTRRIETLPPGTRRPAIVDLADALVQIQPAPDGVPLRIDARLDATIALPATVAEEAIAAASVLWRVFGAPATAVVDLRRWFLNTHGTDRLVPIRDLLDECVSGPVIGLLDGPGVAHPETPPWRARWLGRLATTALRTDEAIELTPDDLALPNDTTCNATPPASADLFALLASPSVADLDAGVFMLIEPRFGPGVGGATAARFTNLLDTAAFGTFAAATRPPRGGVYAEVEAEPIHAASRNLHRTTGWIKYRICLDRTPVADHEIGIDDLAVGASEDAMFLVSRRLGRMVTPVAFHRLTHRLLPAAARLLLAIGADGTGQLHGWSWGPFGNLTYLPRVSYGRAVLSLARWRLPEALLDPAVADDEWLRLLSEWAATEHLPDTVTAGAADRRLPLRLSSPMEARLLRREVQRRGVAVITEYVEPGAWLGGRAVELVLPMRTARATQQPVPRRAQRIDFGSHAARIALPGGCWLSAELDVPIRLQNQVLRGLADGLGAVLSEADRWFFVRFYRDGLLVRPHLRLRVAGPREHLSGTVLPTLHDWAAALRVSGLAGDLRLVPYDAEVERYGGPQVFPAAEQLACADSLAIVALLQAEQPGLADLPVLALSCLDILGALDPGRQYSGWLRGIHGHADRRWRAEVFANAATGWMPAALGSDVDAAWEHRRAAARQLHQTLTAADSTGSCWTEPDRIVESVIHMHCNRLVGRNPDLERAALRLVRDVVAADVARGLGA